MSRRAFEELYPRYRVTILNAVTMSVEISMKATKIATLFRCNALVLKSMAKNESGMLASFRQLTTDVVAHPGP